jgi:hypothetical protein
MLSRRVRRRAEQGQALIMALAFIAFFGLVTTAVLQFADTVELQQSHAQATSELHAEAEGGMFLAAEAAAQKGSCALPSTPVAITMAGTDDGVGYVTTACNPGATADLIADQCAVCVLGQSGVKPTLSVQGTLTARGPIAVTGDASSGVVLPAGTADTRSTVTTSGGLEPGFIACSGTCGPDPSADYLPAAGTLTEGPSPTVTPPSVTPEYGCQPFTGDGTGGSHIPAGCYSSISVDCSGVGVSCSYQLDPGVFVIDGRFRIGDNSGLTTTVNAPGSVLLAFMPKGHGDPGGSLLINPSGVLNLDDGPILGNDDVVLYAEPGAGGITIDDGGSLSAQGTLFAPSAALDVNGTGTVTINPNAPDVPSGDLIVGSLSVDTQADVSVTATPPSPGYCWVYADNVLDGASNVIGQVVVESDCSGGSGTHIISINYGS